MKGVVRKGVKQKFSIFLIGVVSVLIFDRALYTHIHVLPDGSLISHAHPFPGSSEDESTPDHQHSNQELFLLAHLDVMIIGSTAALSIVQDTGPAELLKLTEDQLFSALVPFSPGRAPPCSS
jgi:hypothetical protein